MTSVNVSSDSTSPTLVVDRLTKHFPLGGNLLSKPSEFVHAVDGISFSVRQGETLGLVGESGCGKSTAGKTILRLLEPTSGKIELMGRDITHLSRAQLRPLRRQMQMIFQDPYSSLNPRMSVGKTVAEPLSTHGLGKGSRVEIVAELFRKVGLRPDQMADYPQQFSGGQRQRIAIARALAVNPRLIVGDEPVSALDVSIQAQVINLLMDLQEEYALSYVFIAHDLAVVEQISHRIAVMYLGRIVELADTAALMSTPLHPYTQALLSAIPVPQPRKRQHRQTLGGDVPSPIRRPSGCHFHTRCPRAVADCRVTAPILREIRPGHTVACHLA
ncbi:peptide/nickel transport system ATP-binding protein/oligopeptide transport system ATP-binding protein [Rhodoligotrophos appendicifer]|uniref:ABC transporter ATP-binding protein n=1 Tax=Rhodoligotrophos appendicifer TaxID=987056 RepID=UPI00117C1EDB|nr:oligopeptide/dipeptide ABC transporter ATP-binding protein [Rhodoligotrophos appendicifer]